MPFKFRILTVFLALFLTNTAFASNQAVGESKVECATELARLSLRNPLDGPHLPDLAAQLKMEDLVETGTKAERYTWMTTDGTLFAKYKFAVTDAKGNEFNGRLRMNFKKLTETDERTGELVSEAYLCSLALEMPLYKFTLAHALYPLYFTPYVLKNKNGKVIQIDRN